MTDHELGQSGYRYHSIPRDWPEQGRGCTCPSCNPTGLDRVLGQALSWWDGVVIGAVEPGRMSWFERVSDGE